MGGGSEGEAGRINGAALMASITAYCKREAIS